MNRLCQLRDISASFDGRWLTRASADGLASDTLAGVAEYIVEWICLETPTLARTDTPRWRIFDTLKDAQVIGLLKKP